MTVLADTGSTAPAGLHRYNGGKNGAGVYQAIINRIPRHGVYVEAFAGSAAIYRRKVPAASSILVERDPAVVDQLRRHASPSTQVLEENALEWLARLSRCQLEGWFIYLDPPYLHSTRSRLDLYRYELSDADHQHLVASVLPALSAAGARWALSGYRSAMYDQAAITHRWMRTDFQAMTRRGLRTESLWTNYDPADLPPAELTYHGTDYRDRERLKRKAARWVAKLQAMPPRDRAYLMQAMLASTDGAAGGAR